MKIVYVKHFLTEEGMDFFSQSWFPRVKSALTKQKGFISIEAYRSKTENECLNITLQFANDATLQAWVKTDIHAELIDLLDPYRIRDWLWASVEIANPNDPHDIVWNTAIPKTIVYDRKHSK